jgi:hypothetical protein
MKKFLLLLVPFVAFGQTTKKITFSDWVKTGGVYGYPDSTKMPAGPIRDSIRATLSRIDSIANVNVHLFGVKPTNIDNRAAFQSVLDKYPNGARLYFPAGRYKFKMSTIGESFVLKNHVIIGAGRDSTILELYSDQDNNPTPGKVSKSLHFFAPRYGTCELKDLTLFWDWHLSDTVNNRIAAVNGRAGSNEPLHTIILDNVRILGFPGALWDDYSRAKWIMRDVHISNAHTFIPSWRFITSMMLGLGAIYAERCIFDSAASYLLYFGGTGRFTDCVLKNWGLNNADNYGVHKYGSASPYDGGMSFERCEIVSKDTGYGVALLFASGSYVHNTVRNCYIRANNALWIWGVGDYDIANNTIVANNNALGYVYGHQRGNIWRIKCMNNNFIFPYSVIAFYMGQSNQSIADGDSLSEYVFEGNTFSRVNRSSFGITFLMYKIRNERLVFRNNVGVPSATISLPNYGSKAIRTEFVSNRDISINIDLDSSLVIVRDNVWATPPSYRIFLGKVFATLSNNVELAPVDTTYDLGRPTMVFYDTSWANNMRFTFADAYFGGAKKSPYYLHTTFYLANAYNSYTVWEYDTIRTILVGNFAGNELKRGIPGMRFTLVYGKNVVIDGGDNILATTYGTRSAGTREEFIWDPKFKKWISNK